MRCIVELADGTPELAREHEPKPCKAVDWVSRFAVEDAKDSPHESSARLLGARRHPALSGMDPRMAKELLPVDHAGWGVGQDLVEIRTG